MGEMAYESAYEPKVSWLTRLRWKLFPSGPPPFNAGDPRTYLTTQIHTTLGWQDRLRALVSGRLRATVITYTDVEVKQADSVTLIWFE